MVAISKSSQKLASPVIPSNQLFLTDREVALRYSTGRATPWRWCKSRNFPNPVKLSPGCTRWKLSDLEVWEQTRGDAA